MREKAGLLMLTGVLLLLVIGQASAVPSDELKISALNSKGEFKTHFVKTVGESDTSEPTITNNCGGCTKLFDIGQEFFNPPGNPGGPLLNLGALHDVFLTEPPEPPGTVPTKRSDKISGELHKDVSGFFLLLITLTSDAGTSLGDAVKGDIPERGGYKTFHGSCSSAQIPFLPAFHSSLRLPPVRPIHRGRAYSQYPNPQHGQFSRLACSD